MRRNLNELQFVAVQLAQNLIGLLQVFDHHLVVGADAVQRDADDVHRHVRAVAEDALKILLFHFQHGAFGGGSDCGGSRCVLNERHFTNHAAAPDQA